MKLVKFTPAMARRWLPGSAPRRCLDCRANIRPGQWVFTHRLPRNGFVDTDINIHAACMAARVEHLEPDDYDPTDIKAAVSQRRREERRLTRAERLVAAG